MKKIILFFIIINANLFAQNNIGTIYCNQNDLTASRYQPSELSLKNNHIQIAFNYYSWMGNSTFKYKSANDIYKKDTIKDEDINRIIGKLHKKNIIGAGEDFQVFGIAFQNKSTQPKKYVISFSIVDKFSANVFYTDNFMKLALKGNKQFAGQKVNIGPLHLNAQYRREFVLGMVTPLLRYYHSIGIRLGARIKLLQGMASLYMQRGNAAITTDAQGRYIDADLDYQLNISGLKNFSPFKVHGWGYGLDLGSTFYFSNKIQLVVSVLNLGSIYFNNTTTTYEKSGTIHYDGLAFDGFFEKKISGDSLQKVLVPNKTEGNTFRMPLDTKFSITGEFKTYRKYEEGREYVNNSFFFTYVQGLNNMPGATTRPFLSLGYNHIFHKVLNGGFSMSGGGYNAFAFGSFFALNIKKVRVGFSSDDLTTLIFPQYGTGVDFAINLSVSL